MMHAIPLKGMTTLIEVFNMETSIKFYSEALGFQVFQSAGNEHGLGWAWLKNGGIELMLNSMYNPGERPELPDAVRVEHHRDTALYFGCPDVDRAYERLQSMGIEAAAPETATYGMRQCYLRDPDGYHICLQWKA